jgi:hypothetical protein
MLPMVALFWLLIPISVAAYLLSRRSYPRSHTLLVFDAFAVLAGAGLCVAFFWREITGHISQDIWLDEREFMPILVPMYSAGILILFFLLAATVRHFIFSSAHSHASRGT